MLDGPLSFCRRAQLAAANEDFPHQSTGDQFFSESQFESYRALGFEIADDLLKRAILGLKNPAQPKFEDIAQELMTDWKNEPLP